MKNISMFFVRLSLLFFTIDLLGQRRYAWSESLPPPLDGEKASETPEGTLSAQNDQSDSISTTAISEPPTSKTKVYRKVTTVSDGDGGTITTIVEKSGNTTTTRVSRILSIHSEEYRKSQKARQKNSKKSKDLISTPDSEVDVTNQELVCQFIGNDYYVNVESYYENGELKKRLASISEYTNPEKECEIELPIDTFLAEALLSSPPYKVIKLVDVDKELLDSTDDPALYILSTYDDGAHVTDALVFGGPNRKNFYSLQSNAIPKEPTYKVTSIYENGNLYSREILKIDDGKTPKQINEEDLPSSLSSELFSKEEESFVLTHYANVQKLYLEFVYKNGEKISGYIKPLKPSKPNRGNTGNGFP